MAAIVFLNGLFAISEVLFVRFSVRLEALLPINFEYYSRSLGLFSGFVLVYFSIKLWERKRLAWWIALVGSTLTVIAHLLYVRHFDALILPAASLVLLLAYRDQFPARSEATSIAQGFRLLIACLLIALLYGVVGFTFLRPRDFVTANHQPYHKISLQEATRRTVAEFSLVGNDDIKPRTRHARWFIDSLDLLGLASLGFAVYSLFRPLAYRYATRPAERERASKLLELYGNSSEDAFKLWPADKSYFFSPSGNSFLAYRVASGTALCLGDPTGVPNDFSDLLEAFQRYCLGHDWLVALIYVTATHVELYETANMRVVKIGEDAIINLAEFCNTVVSGKHFRGVGNKFERKGYSFERIWPPYSGSLLTELRAVTQDWLKVPGRQERSFALGYHDRNYLARSPLALVRNEHGKLLAFVNQIRSYRAGRASIDLMRHRLNVETGTMDWLLMRLAQELQAEGMVDFNLGLAPLSGVGQTSDDALEEKILGYLYDSRFGGFAFAGLRQFKAKFEPQWEPMYLAYQPGPSSLARVAMGVRKLLG